jgi:hypothetical protein
MAGPASMALGGFAFESHGFSFTDRGSQLNTNWAEIEVSGGLNPAQWTGGQSKSIRIRGVLFPQEFGGLDVLDGIARAAESGEILPLVGLDNPRSNIRGMWRIESVGEDSSLFYRGGPLRDAYQIALKQYQATGGGGGFRPSSVLSLF